MSLYSSQLIAFAVVIGFVGFLLLSQRKLRPRDRDRLVGRALVATSGIFVALAIYANATAPYIR